MKIINGKLKLDYLKGIILIKLKFTFYKSGILINENYIRKLFFNFVNKFKN